MPSAQEIGVAPKFLPEKSSFTIYTPTGSRSWSGDLALIEEDRKALDCKICETSSEEKIIFLSPRRQENIVTKIVKQPEAQAAQKTP